jgi:choline monooxygenase
VTGPTLTIDPDITSARTPPAEFYSGWEWFELCRERVFARSWQIVADADALRAPGQVLPVTLLEGLLDEPLLLTRDRRDRLHCLSNVCTHRGALVCPAPARASGLTCPYHGRRFGLDGVFRSMPEFEGVAGFPSPADDLPRVPFGAWGKLVFAAPAPGHELDGLLAPMRERLGFIDTGALVLDPARSRDYVVRANWALYVDNYLEGFHIPYVHAGLNAALDYGQYATELYGLSSLQLGIARNQGEGFEPPEGAADHGRSVAAYYWWLFPNTMINAYPWGISVNIVRPLAPDRTRVSFISYVGDPARLEEGAGAALDRVEREDEAVIETVQRGLAGRLYRRGRYSPSREVGVHHFHRLLAEAFG